MVDAQATYHRHIMAVRSAKPQIPIGWNYAARSGRDRLDLRSVFLSVIIPPHEVEVSTDVHVSHRYLRVMTRRRLVGLNIILYSCSHDILA